MYFVCSMRAFCDKCSLELIVLSNKSLWIEYVDAITLDSHLMIKNSSDYKLLSMGRFTRVGHLENGPKTAIVVSAPLPIKLLSLASPSH